LIFDPVIREYRRDGTEIETFPEVGEPGLKRRYQANERSIMKPSLSTKILRKKSGIFEKPKNPVKNQNTLENFMTKITIKEDEITTTVEKSEQNSKNLESSIPIEPSIFSDKSQLGVYFNRLPFTVSRKSEKNLKNAKNRRYLGSFHQTGHNSVEKSTKSRDRLSIRMPNSAENFFKNGKLENHKAKNHKGKIEEFEIGEKMGSMRVARKASRNTKIEELECNLEEIDQKIENDISAKMLNYKNSPIRLKSKNIKQRQKSLRTSKINTDDLEKKLIKSYRKAKVSDKLNILRQSYFKTSRATRNLAKSKDKPKTKNLEILRGSFERPERYTSYDRLKEVTSKKKISLNLNQFPKNKISPYATDLASENFFKSNRKIGRNSSKSKLLTKLKN
jgi:hypothetical protein